MLSRDHSPARRSESSDAWASARPILRSRAAAGVMRQRAEMNLSAAKALRAPNWHSAGRAATPSESSGSQPGGVTVRTLVLARPLEKTAEGSDRFAGRNVCEHMQGGIRTEVSMQ